VRDGEGDIDGKASFFWWGHDDLSIAAQYATLRKQPHPNTTAPASDSELRHQFIKRLNKSVCLRRRNDFEAIFVPIEVKVEMFFFVS